MKVLMIAGALPPDRCGVGDYTARLANALHQAGCDVDLVGSTGAAPPPAGRLLSRMDSWRFSHARRLIAAIRGSDADIVHIQFPTAGYDAIWLPSLVPAIARFLGKRAVMTFREVQSWGEVRYPRSTLRFLLHAFGPGRIVTTRAGFRAQLHPVLRWLSQWVEIHHIPIAANIERSTLTEPERQALRERYLDGRTRLIAYFGFIAPAKGVEDLLAVVDRKTDRLLFIADPDEAIPYHRSITAQLAATGETAIVTGYKSSPEVADMLAAADAVVLPFRDGASDTNGTVHAAALQGSYVLTTSPDDAAFDDAASNIERVPRNDISALHAALDCHAGRRIDVARDAGQLAWHRIAQDHLSLYSELIDHD